MDTKPLWKRTEQDDHHLCRLYGQRYSNDPQWIIKAYLSLPEGHRASYDVMFTQQANLPFSIQAFKRWHGSVATGAMLRAAWGMLLAKGLLASIRTASGDRKLFIPDNIYSCLLAYHLDRASSTYARIDEQQNQANAIKPTRCPLRGLHDREQGDLSVNTLKGLRMSVFHLLVYALLKGLPLTAKGLLHKKVVSQLDSMLQLDGEVLSQLNMNVFFAPSLPLHVAFVLDMALRLSLLRRDATCYVVQLEQLNGWLNLSDNEALHVMAAAVIDHYLPKEALNRHLAYSVLYLGKEGKCSSDETIMNRFFDLGWLNEDKHSLNDIRVHIRTWLRMAHALGWCDISTDGGRWIFRVIDYGETHIDAFLFVQPDFEILVTPQTPFSVRFELEMFSRLRAEDQIDIYQLTRKSFEEGLKYGRSVSFVMSFLKAHSLTGVPDNVRDALEMWERSWEGKGQDDIPILWQEHHSEQRDLGTIQVETVYSSSSLQYDEMDTHLLEDDVETLCTDDIANQWTRALRPYHISTKRDMVMAAVRHQTQLEVECKGQTAIIVPLSLCTANERKWTVKAYVLPCPPNSEWVQLCPEEWDRIRMIMPESLF